MTHKTREQLTNMFRQGAKPTGDDFKEFIESMLNFEDDGIEKRQGDQPLKIRAWGSNEKILELCGTDKQLRWSLDLKSDDKVGLSIKIPNGDSKMFLDASGKLGLGTNDPKATLDVNGGGKMSGALAVGGVLTVAGPTTLSGNLTATKDVSVSGNTTLAGTLSVAETMSITGDTSLGGTLTLNTGTADFGQTTRQMLNLYQKTYGIGVQSSTQYFRSNKNFAWYKKGTHHNNELNPGTGGTAMMVIRDGKVGIGTNSPTVPLHVQGDVTVSGAITGAAQKLSIKKNRAGVKRVVKSSAKIVSGSTTPGVGWVQHGANGIYIVINTADAGFTSTPVYFTSLSGKGSHWTTQGATSIYSATKKSLKIYIHGTAVILALARDQKWYINWVGIGT